MGDLNPANMEYESGEILASIIANGFNLFKLDLEGVNVLLIPMLNALNAVFKLKYPQKEDLTTTTSLASVNQASLKSETGQTGNKPKEMVRSVFAIGSSTVSLVELKRFCVYIFSSLLSLPNHFGSLVLNDLNNGSR